MFRLKIDARERDLISLVKGKLVDIPDVPLDIESLDVGDIAIEKDGCPLILIERKKVSDLAASITDGRYKEQSYRLDGYPVPNHNIVYLIEGNLNQTRMDKKTLNSCVFSLNYVKGFSIWKTTNLEDSATFLVNSVRYLSKGGDKPPYYKHCETEEKEQNEKDYASVVKTAKKENITPNNIGEIMLSQIPGISVNVAMCIIQHFKCIVNLIADLQEKGVECLHEVQVPHGKGGVRKLNKTCIANLQKFLIEE